MEKVNLEKMKAFGKVFGYLVLVGVSLTAGAAVWPGFYFVGGCVFNFLVRSIYDVFVLVTEK